VSARRAYTLHTEEMGVIEFFQRSAYIGRRDASFELSQTDRQTDAIHPDAIHLIIRPMLCFFLSLYFLKTDTICVYRMCNGVMPTVGNVSLYTVVHLVSSRLSAPVELSAGYATPVVTVYEYE